MKQIGKKKLIFGTIKVWHPDTKTITEKMCATCLETSETVKVGIGKPKGLNSILGIAETYIRHFRWCIKNLYSHDPWHM